MNGIRVVPSVLFGGLFAWGLLDHDTLFSTGWWILSPVVGAAALGFLYGVRSLEPVPGSRLRTAAAAAFLWVLLSGLFLVSVPKVYGLLPLETHKVSGIIAEKYDASRLGYRMSLEGCSHLLCFVRVSREQWSRVEVGSRVDLSVTRSGFGLRVLDIRPADPGLLQAPDWRTLKASR